jgi:transposase/tetratricopeptide (TPR) repeat protein
MNNREVLRVKATQYYLNNNISLRKTALKFHIACCTLFRWVKLYKKQGEEGLLSTYKRPWNRTDPDLEERIVLMKEHEPGLTVRQAKKRLEKEGIRISIKGVWGIWKRYGYAGFSHTNMSSSFTDCLWSKEAKTKYELANQLFNQGTIDRSAKVLNSIPALPENELLPKIPDSMLDIRRRVEKIDILFGKIPVGFYLERLRDLYEECHHRNLYYSALLVGLVETKALSWNGEPLKMLKRAEELKDMLKETGNSFSYLLFGPRLSLLISEGFAYKGLLKIKEALDRAKTCRILLKRRKYISPLFMRDLGQLYAHLEDFEEAKYWYLKSIDSLSGEEKKITKSFLADTFIVKGEYKKALEVLENEELDHWGSHSKIPRVKSMWSLIKGMPHRAISLATEVLASLEKEEAKGSIFGCYFTIASAYCSLGEKVRARHILKGLLPFLKKNRLQEVKAIIEILLSPASAGKGSMPLRELCLPTIKVLLLLKKGQYARALKYAEKKGLLGLLHRYVFFFPETITGLLEKGKSTSLPRTMLDLPVFRKEIPVYSVKFLGNVIVYRNQKPLRVKLNPKDASFLIFLACSREKSISLDRIYNNFWPRSKRPSRNLAHLLVKIRKSLRLPSHYLRIKEKRLYFDCYFSTDYEKYKEHLAQAKAFSRAGEWRFAKREYLRAFKLFRDEPFKKMYDNWSDDKRLEILFSYDTEVTTFIRELIKRGRKEEADRFLKTARKIAPDLDLRLSAHSQPT